MTHIFGDAVKETGKGDSGDEVVGGEEEGNVEDELVNNTLA